MVRKVICALDTSSLEEALTLVRRLCAHVGAFKIGHALTLPHGLDVIKRLQDEGASRIFLDLKFHDIPNSVALAVCEAAKANVWMMTLHISGGPAMLNAAVEEARSCGEETAPILLGVSVLTSLDQHVLTDHLGVGRTVEEHMVYLSKLAIDCGLDGVVCSPEEIKAIRGAIGHPGVIVTPGIRLSHGATHDQKRVGDAQTALADGADYLVIGRALTDQPDPEAALAAFGFQGVKDELVGKRFNEDLLAWYGERKRDLPWRGLTDPYAIWVSEVMLQQTQVRTAWPYFERWIAAFPTVDALAAASEQDALTIWQGLGYYRRCRMLLQGARMIAELGMPTTFAGWRAIPGVGSYTAGAIASIAFRERVPAVDCNVLRVYSRLDNCSVAGGALGRMALAWASHNVSRTRPGEWNEAMMELGATKCRPRAPLCEQCPIARHCLARRAGRARDLPTKPAPTKMIDQERRIIVHRKDGRFGVRPIKSGTWWTGMWEFPTEVGSPGGDGVRLGRFIHTVTRHRIAYHVVLSEGRQDIDLRWLTIDELKTIPLPGPYRRALALVLAVSS